MLSQFLILGVINNSGSFALAQEQSQLFFKAVEGYASMITHVVNTQFIGAPALGLLNNIEEPRLVVVGIDEPSLEELASFLGRLFKFNILTPDDSLEDYLRKRAKLPVSDPETAREPKENKPDNTDDKSNTDDNKTTKEKAIEKEKIDG